MKQHLEPVEVVRYENGQTRTVADLVSVEEPLGIRLKFHRDAEWVSKDLSITMRTPGNDAELAMGFLYTEGIIRSADEIADIKFTESDNDCWVEVELQGERVLDLNNLERHFYTTSSCGVCGKTSMAAVQQACPVILPQKKWRISQEILRLMPEVLRKSQNNFEYSGGIHACGLFDLQGTLVAMREDVGRHNALDKLIGWSLNAQQIPLFNHVLILSGRASFELIQKAAMAGIRMVVAIGAPSSLAVALAEEFDISLVGFLKENRFNVYHGADRISF
jgi:FdhD protein